MVQWIDAEGSSDRWEEPHSTEEWVLNDWSGICVTVGFKVAETKKYLVLACSVHSGAWGGMWKIGKNTIVKKERLWPYPRS